MPRIPRASPSPPSPLRQRRNELGYSLRRTGNRANINYRRVWELEQGAAIRLHEIYALAAALTCTPDTLRSMHGASHIEAGAEPDADVDR